LCFFPVGYTTLSTMAAEDDADGLQLNLVLAQDTQPRQSRTQQRKQKWRQQRAIKVGQSRTTATLVEGAAQFMGLSMFSQPFLTEATQRQRAKAESTRMHA
jgi:hypothetical protein